MENKRLLTRKERAYLIKKITKGKDPNFDMLYKRMSPKQEKRFILRIILKIQAPQNIPLDQVLKKKFLRIVGGR